MTWSTTDLMPGMYVCVRGGQLGGWFIRTVTRAPVAHVVIYIGTQPNGFDAIEAWTSGVRYCHVTDYDPKSAFPAKDVLTDAESAGMTATAISLIGTDYGYLSDILIGFRVGLHAWLPRWLFRLKGVTKNMQCAQTADYIALVNGRHYFDDERQPGEVSPAALWRRHYS